MEPFSKLRPPDAIRIKVKLADPMAMESDTYSINSDLSTLTTASAGSYNKSHNAFFNHSSKKFFVNPQATSYEILSDLIRDAFFLKEAFQMSYLNRDAMNSQAPEYISLYSDWDLDAAFLNSSKPFLAILLTPVNASANGLTSPDSANSTIDEWDVITAHDLKPLTTLTSHSLNNHKPQIAMDACKSLDRPHNHQRSGSFTDPTHMTKRKSLISLWSNNAADKAVSVFQKVFSGFSRSNSFSSTTSSNHSQYIPFQTSLNNSTALSHSQYNPPISPLRKQPAEQQIQIGSSNLFTNYSKLPLGEAEYRNFIDSDGLVVQLTELRQRIFDGGCNPTLRKETWPLLLDIYPHPMTRKQRTEFILQKSGEYNQLKSSLWFNLNKSILKNEKLFNIFDVDSTAVDTDSLTTLAHNIQKDVCRTDKQHRFFAGDSNKNIESLFNILMTYSLSNGGFYAQGMSDLLSPLLFTLRDEPLSFICFQALMKRCSGNFDILSEEIANKIALLTTMISRWDPVFWMYLSQLGADELCFTYRWLLIECKREFPFDDSLRVLEVMWSTVDAQRLNNDDSYSFRHSKNKYNSNSGTKSPSDEYPYDSMMSDEDMRERANSHKLSTPNMSSINKNPGGNGTGTIKETADNNSICGSCLRKKSQDMSVNGEESERPKSVIQVVQNDSTDSESSLSGSEDSDGDPLGGQENEINDGEAEFKLNRQRWKQYKRIQQANRMKARRPRYFSLNVLMDKVVGQSIKTTPQKPPATAFNKSNEHSMTSSQTHPNTKPSSLIEKQRTRISLVLSNLDLRKRQLEDKYEVNSETPLAAKNYLLRKASQTQPHSCVIRNKQRSSSLSCIECLSLHDSFNSEFTKQKIYKKRNSLFGPKHTEDLLSALPRLMELSRNRRDLTDDTEYRTNILQQSASCFLSNISEADKADADDESERGKKKLRKKTRFSERPGKANSTSNTISNKIRILKSSEDMTKDGFGPPNGAPNQEQAKNSEHSGEDEDICNCPSNLFTSETSSNQNTKDRLMMDSPNVVDNSDLLPSRKKSSATSAVGSSISSISSNCSTPFLAATNSTGKHHQANPASSSSSGVESMTKAGEDNKGIFRQRGKTTPTTTATIVYEDNLIPSSNFDDVLEEDLIYSLSKLDNPFLLFICFSIFIEHRDHIMRNEMDVNDIACFFDKMARKHNMRSILNRARYLYTQLYLSKTNVFSYMQQANEIEHN